MTPDRPEDASEPDSSDAASGASDGGQAPKGKGPAAKPKKAEQDPDAELLYDELDVAGEDELRAAMDWAFEKEDVTPELLDAYARHAHMVLEGNRTMNLTAIVEPREVAAKHYLDSWRATRLIPLMGRSLLDLGTGAGFPGIPVALAEDMAKVHLVDSTRKRIDFVQSCIDALAIKNATAEWIRAEEYLARNEVDIVLVRAVSSVRENVRLLRKVRHSHKDLVMLRGPSWSREARAGEREAERLGFRLDTVWEHELPEGMGKRAILVYRAPGGAGI